MAQTKGTLSSKRYLGILAKTRRITRREGIDVALRKHHLDALVVPSGGLPWPIDLLNGDPHTWNIEAATLAAIAGYPHITVPSGYVCGLPVSISFIAKAWQEPILIRLAYALEQATQSRVPPQFLPTVDLSSIGIS